MKTSRIWIPIGLALLALPATSPAWGVDFTATDDAQFDAGVKQGVNNDAPNNNQLQLNATGSTFPVLWVANAGEDTVSRIDTNANCETARYRTWFAPTAIHGAFSGPAPSRTAVDGDGNVYVANRHFDGLSPAVLKILLEGGIDRNGNGVIDTSGDRNGDCVIQPDEMIDLVDSNGNGVLDDAELADERLAWIEQVGNPGQLGRSLCIAGDGDIWLGTYFTPQYYELSPADGSVLRGPVATGDSNYGCVVDSDGILYGATLSVTMNVVDTNTATSLGTLSHSQFGANYGISAGNGKAYLASSSGFSYIQYDPNEGPGEPDGNPATGTFTTPAQTQQLTLGISVEGDNDIVLGNNPVRKFDAADGSVVWSAANPSGSNNTRGILPDSNNDIWAVNLDANNVTKFDGDDGSFLATVPVGASPYTYSDATGFAFVNTTNPQGTFTTTFDGGAGALWDGLFYNSETQGVIPPGASIEVAVRVADTEADLALQNFQSVANGASGLGLSGRFIQVRATLRPSPGGSSPVLSDLTTSTAAVSQLTCDINADNQIDLSDIQAIADARGRTVPPANPALDVNGDGIVSVNDTRFCVLRCDQPRCR